MFSSEKFYFFCVLVLTVLITVSCAINPVKSNDNENETGENEILELESRINEQISNFENPSSDNKVSNNSISSEESILIMQDAYYYFFSGNIPEFINMFSDDIQLVHQGVENPLLPFYGVYSGTDGLMMWLYNLGSSATFNGFNMNYMFAENNKVEVSILEDAYMNPAQNTVRIENLHSFVLNEDKKICKMFIISESETVYNSLNGTPGEIYETENKVGVYNTANLYNINYYKIMSLYAVLYMHKNSSNKLKRFVSEDIEITIPGNEEIVPFAGKYTGKKELKSFVKAFSKEKIILLPEGIVSGFNKVHYQYNIIGCVKDTGKIIDTMGILSFQFDDNGKILKIYNFYDTQALKIAYTN